MTRISSLHPRTRAWLLDGPLSPHVPAYISRLKRGRYAATTARSCLAAVAHFAHWMSMCRMPVHVLDDDCVDFFLRVHLPCCDCPPPALRVASDLHAALVALLATLRHSRCTWSRRLSRLHRKLHHSTRKPHQRRRQTGTTEHVYHQ